MSSKDHVRKWRERLAKNPEKKKEHLERERIRDKFRREQKKEKVDKRIEAERKRKYRARKKAEAQELAACNSLLPKAYNCPQTLGKAVKKVKLALPADSLKKKVVLETLLATENVGIKVQTDKPKRTSSNKIPCEIVDKVKGFYQRDDISRQAPGIKDTKSIKNPETGKRESIQKRHLVMTTKEAFQIFRTENPESVIHISTFVSLRPQHVLTSSDMPHNVCVCTYHANINFILEAVSKEISDFPKDHRSFLEKVACDINNEACMTGVCKNCTIDNFDGLIPPGTNIEKCIAWSQWKKVAVEKENKKSQKEKKETKESQDGKISSKKKKKEIMKLVPFEAPIKDALKQLLTQTLKFKTHVFVKNVQSKYFEEKKRNIGEDEAVLQSDFAENASTVYQDESQSAYYAHGQVTVFTCCVWLKNDTISISIVSDDLTHNKYSVWTFFKVICSELKRQYPHLKTLTTFTDGCAGQFKSKYVMSNLCYFQKDFNLQCEWNFFATSHGKGAVDGIGATVKRTVWQKVKNRQVVVATAEDFYKCANSSLNGIKILYVPKDEIDQNKEMLKLRTELARPIPAIKSQHHFRYFDSKNLLVGRTFQSELKKCKVIKDAPIEVKANNNRKSGSIAARKGANNRKTGSIADRKKANRKTGSPAVRNGGIYMKTPGVPHTKWNYSDVYSDSDSE